MTTDEAAKKWGRSRSSIVKMIEEGRIPARKIRRDGEKSRWDKLPDWVIVTMRDFAGMFDCCPKDAEVLGDEC